MAKEENENPFLKYTVPSGRGVNNAPVEDDLGLMEMITGSKRNAELPENVRNLPELGSQFSFTGNPKQDAHMLAGIVSTFDPEARKNIIKQAVPEVEFEEFGDTTVIKLPNGKRAILNKAGVSASDLVPVVAQALAFTPAGRLAMIGGNLLVRGGALAAGSYATDLGIQKTAQALGSKKELDHKQAAITAATAPIPDTAVAGIQGGRRIIDAAKAQIPDQMKNTLDKGRVFTSDMFPPETFIGANLKRLGEKIPFIGTGNLRSTQQAERQQAVRDLAGEFDIDINTPFEADVVASADDVFRKSRERAGNLRSSAVNSLQNGGDVDTPNTIKVIDKEISKQSNLGERGDEALIRSLQTIKNELYGNFERVGNIRTTIHQQISDISKNNSPIKSGGEAALENVRRALKRDMSSFAKRFSAAAKSSGDTEGGRAYNRWEASNRIFKEGFDAAKDAKIKNVLSKGEATPEIVTTILKSGKLSDLNRLKNNLDLDGRVAARQAILREVFESSGGLDDINPTRVINELQKKNLKRATDVFFTGSAKKELDGFKRYLDLTRGAQEANVLTRTGQELLAPSAMVATGFEPTIGIPVLAGISGGARVFESEAVRDIMIKLANTKSRKGQEELLVKLRPLLAEESRRLQEQE